MILNDYIVTPAQYYLSSKLLRKIHQTELMDQPSNQTRLRSSLLRNYLSALELILDHKFATFTPLL